MQSIPRRARYCLGCETPFTHEMEYHSTLSDPVPEKPAVRKDFCLECWTSHADAEKAACFIHWRSKVPSAKKKYEGDKERDEQALELLKEQLSDEERRAECFILALYLARKKILLQRQEISQDGKDFTLYEVAETEEMLPVEKVPVEQLNGQRIREEIYKQFQVVESPQDTSLEAEATATMPSV